MTELGTKLHTSENSLDPAITNLVQAGTLGVEGIYREIFFRPGSQLEVKPLQPKQERPNDPLGPSAGHIHWEFPRKSGNYHYHNPNNKFDTGYRELPEHHDRPTVFRNLFDSATMQDCSTSLDRNSFVAGSLAQRRIEVHHEDDFQYPTTKHELDQMTTESGQGFVILEVDHHSPVIVGVRRALREVLEVPLRVSAYISPASQSVVPRHRDTRPVLAVQAGGKKMFEVAGPSDAAEKPDEITLNPGDALFLPAGIEHRAQSITDSIHLGVILSQIGED